MGLFDLFRRKRTTADLLPLPSELAADGQDANKQPEQAPPAGIDKIYVYLQRDFEKQGYDDAHISADEGYKNDNIRYDLEILIHQVKTYHSSLLKDIDFHIQSRGRAGLIDLVDELKIKQTDLNAHMAKVEEMEYELKNNTGLCERAVLAYKRGFMKGMASITQAYLLSKKF